MGCNSGCGTGSTNLPAGCNNNGACGVGDSCGKLSVFDWLGNMNLPEQQKAFDIVEVRFKNSRKEFFRNVNNLSLNIGEAIAVEAGMGHDIGMVTLTGELVKMQLRKKNINFDSEEIKKVYRKARQNDIDKWKEAQQLETETMFRARTIALKMGLAMKLSDVEYQGDKSKATFYYTAEARVDFRELIKVLAEEFKTRIDMRQIGARQEASRLGGIGSCGRELCCSTWLTDFRAVTTSAARYQQLSLNPSKLAGQCGKLKCCLNYELDSYTDALKEFPDMESKKLQTKKGNAFLQKTDIFKRLMWFSYPNDPGVFIPMDLKTINEILEANKNGIIPDELKAAQIKDVKTEAEVTEFKSEAGKDSLERFDKKNKQSKRNPNQKRHGKPNTSQSNRNQSDSYRIAKKNKPSDGNLNKSEGKPQPPKPDKPK